MVRSVNPECFQKNQFQYVDKLYSIYPDQEIYFDHMLQATAQPIEVSNGALLFFYDLQPAALQEDTWFLDWW